MTPPSPSRPPCPTFCGTGTPVAGTWCTCMYTMDPLQPATVMADEYTSVTTCSVGIRVHDHQRSQHLPRPLTTYRYSNGVLWTEMLAQPTQPPPWLWKEPCVTCVGRLAGQCTPRLLMVMGIVLLAVFMYVCVRVRVCVCVCSGSMDASGLTHTVASYTFECGETLTQLPVRYVACCESARFIGAARPFTIEQVYVGTVGKVGKQRCAVQSHAVLWP